MASVCAKLSDLLGKPINEADLLDSQRTEELGKRFGSRQNAVMLGTPIDDFNVRVIGHRWTDIDPFLPAAAALFADDERVVLLHDDEETVGGLLVSVEEVFARAQALAALAGGPGIALISLDGGRGLELEGESDVDELWTLLWWRDNVTSDPQ